MEVLCEMARMISICNSEGRGGGEGGMGDGEQLGTRVGLWLLEGCLIVVLGLVGGFW